MVAGARGVGSGMGKIGFLVVNNVPQREVMLCVECEDRECVMAERFLDMHKVPYKLKIVSGYDTPLVFSGRGDCFKLSPENFDDAALKERMDELRKYCA